MLRFRLRLYRDLRDVTNTTDKLMPLMLALADKQKDTLADEAYKDYTKLNIQQNDGDIQTEQDK
jgi:lipopolysaccharide export system permease protein